MALTSTVPHRASLLLQGLFCFRDENCCSLGLLLFRYRELRCSRLKQNKRGVVKSLLMYIEMKQSIIFQTTLGSPMVRGTGTDIGAQLVLTSETSKIYENNLRLQTVLLEHQQQELTIFWVYTKQM